MRIAINLLERTPSPTQVSWNWREIPTAFFMFALSSLMLNMLLDDLIIGGSNMIATILGIISVVGCLSMGIYFTLRTWRRLQEKVN